jgi:hypothetical protein
VKEVRDYLINEFIKVFDDLILNVTIINLNLRNIYKYGRAKYVRLSRTEAVD